MTNSTNVAKLVSYMGFEIDTSQLERFENLTRGIRASTVNLARNLRVVNNNLSDTNSRFKTFNKNHTSLANSKSLGGISKNYASVSKNVNVAGSSLRRLVPTIDLINPKLKENESRTFALARAWAIYRDRIREVNAELRANKGIPIARSSPNLPIGSNRQGFSGRRTSDPIGGPNVSGFLGNFTPAAALAGGAITAGYAVKEVVTMGREWIKMKNVLTASTDSTTEFNRALKFTEDTTNRLGVNVTEFGLAYAKIMQASKGKLTSSQTEDIFTSFSELAVVLGSSVDDQKGIFRAISQMFSKGKIQMEEINQMAERQVPALAMLTRAYKDLGMTQAEFEKAQREGKLDPTKFIPLMAQYAKEFANNQGALDKALQSSITQQGIFKNKMIEISGALMESGLDRAIGEMFKGLTLLMGALKPLAVYLVQATLGFVQLLKIFKVVASESPAFAFALGLVSTALLGIAFRSKIALAAVWLFAGGTTAALATVKLALIRTGIGAILVGIGYILGTLYQHMNGEKNWITVFSVGIETLGDKLVVFKSLVKSFFVSLEQEYGNSALYKAMDFMTNHNPLNAPFTYIYKRAMDQTEKPTHNSAVEQYKQRYNSNRGGEYQNGSSLLNYKPKTVQPLLLENNIFMNGVPSGKQKSTHNIDTGVLGL